jgi:hypothetical protein
VAFVIGGAVVILAVAPVREVLKFAPLGLPELSLAGLTGLLVLIGCELIKDRVSDARRP